MGFAILFTASSAPSLAKENPIVAVEIKEPKLTESISKKTPKDKKIAIKEFDIDKAFTEAEAYYKASKAWKKLKCVPKSGFICTKRECIKSPNSTYLILDKDKEMISRCRGTACDRFKAEFNQTGVFFNIQTVGPVGTLIRILGDSRYKEITTLGLDAYITNGECEIYFE